MNAALLSDLKKLAMAGPCVAHGCDRPVRARAMCDAHYARVREHGSFAMRGRTVAPAPTERTCIDCHETQPIENFTRHKRWWHSRCNPCRAQHNRAKGYTTWTRYGLSEVEYRELVAASGGVCAICALPAEQNYHGVLVIDHCHASGKVRGLICSACNKALGFFADDPERLEAAAAYLRERS